MGIFSKDSKPKQDKWAKRNQITQIQNRVAQRSSITPSQQPAAPKNPTVIKETYPAVKKEEVKKEPQKKVTDPDLEFQMMYGLDNTTEKKSTTKPVGTAKGTAPVGTTPAVAGTTSVKPFFPKTVYKKLVNKKLNIVIIEGTALVSKEKEKVTQIVKRFLNSDLLCIINYGDVISKSEILEVKDPEKMNIDFAETDQEKTCLYDTLIEVEKLVSSKYMVTEEKEKERVCIDRIEIIGIGTCSDNSSTATKDDALEAFFKICLKNNIATKYYCLTDEYVMNAAKIGFHSIGSISIAYKS